MPSTSAPALSGAARAERKRPATMERPAGSPAPAPPAVPPAPTHNASPCSSTRRAIVREAGTGLPGGRAANTRGTPPAPRTTTVARSGAKASARRSRRVAASAAAVGASAAHSAASHTSRKRAAARSWAASRAGSTASGSTLARTSASSSATVSRSAPSVVRKRRRTEPMRISSPSKSAASPRTRAPLSQVPLAESRSTSTVRRPPTRTAACWREAVSSKTRSAAWWVRPINTSSVTATTPGSARPSMTSSRCMVRG